MANSADPDHAPHNAVSAQDLYCMLTGCSIKIWKKHIKIPPNNPKIGLSYLIRVHTPFDINGLIEIMTNPIRNCRKTFSKSL